MNGKFRAGLLCAALLTACTQHIPVPDGAIILDEAVPLSRAAAVDSAARTVAVNDDSIVVALADEQLTDIRLKIAAADAEGEPLGVTEVENHLAGSGTDVASLRVPAGTRVTVTLTGAADTLAPGRVPLRVKLYGADAAAKPQLGAQIRAFEAWNDATQSGARADRFQKSGLASIDRAIAELESRHGDAALAAEAHLVKSRLLHFHRLDWRGARMEAQRAAQGFANLSRPDRLNIARANYLEALALLAMSVDGTAVDPSQEQAGKLARDALAALVAPDSALGPIERARAIGAQGQLALSQMHAEDATRLFEQARASYHAAGDLADERNMRFALARVLVEVGRFSDAAAAYDPLLPEMDRITDPELRVNAYLAAGRAQSMSNRVDEGLALLLQALPLSREYQLRTEEATALEGLGYIYQYRGDFQQAIAFYDEALQITSTQSDKTEYSFALNSAADVARTNGDLDLAFKLANQSIRASSTPIAQARNHLVLALVYRMRDNLPAAIAEYRKGLAVDLGDPRHHAHTDGKMLLAQALMELEPNTPQDRAEAVKLIAEAVEISAAVKDPYREIQARRAQAWINLKLGKTREALAGFNATLKLAQDYREHSTSTDVRASMLKDEQAAFRGLLDIELAPVAKRPAGELRPATAGELAVWLRLERARQRSFGALRVGTLDAAATAHVDELLQAMARKSLRIAALIDQQLDQAGSAELHALQLDMSRLHAELDNIRSTAAAQHDRMTTSPATATWRPLAPGDVQLSYAIGDQYVYALVRSEKGMRVTRLAPTRKALEQQLAELAGVDARTVPRDIDSALERASEVLLPAGLLPTGTSSVAIVAEGRIAAVPFPALRSPTDPRRRLIETHDVSMITTLLGVDEAPRLARARPYRFVALASGNGTFRAAAEVDPVPKLRATAKEIEIAGALFSARDPAAKIKLFTGMDGNAAALRDIWASGADVVHFATHALADLRQPIASLLVLPATDARGKATYLTAGQVQAWRGDTELVFLSACESAIGPPQYAAGMPGLQRAFLRAGARGVIATLAPVEDVLEQQFAADFYRRYTQGMPAPRALSETQRAWLAPAPQFDATNQLRRRITALSHAYFAG